MHSIALFGGAFDPVHSGHIQLCSAIQSQFQFEDFHIVPCKESLLKPPTAANTKQRLAMLRLAFQHLPDFRIDLQEIEREGPSYTVDSLLSIRKNNPKAAITLIIGFDALLTLPQWHQWQKIIGLANLLILHRASHTNQPLPGEVMDLLKKHQTTEASTLLKQEAGAVLFFNAGDYAISSSHIRESLAQGSSIDSLVPEIVYEYIKQEKLYKA